MKIVPPENLELSPEAEAEIEDALLTAEYPKRADIEAGHAKALARNPPGRKKGQKNKRTLAKEQELKEALEEGITPLQFMLQKMRDEGLALGIRMEAAKNAAPYMHPKLAAIEQNINVTTLHEDALDELE